MKNRYRTRRFAIRALSIRFLREIECGIPSSGNECSYRIAQLREFSHPDWLPRRSLQRGIAILESESLRDIALERQENNNLKTIGNNDLLIMFLKPLPNSTKPKTNKSV